MGGEGPELGQGHWGVPRGQWEGSPAGAGWAREPREAPAFLCLESPRKVSPLKADLALSLLFVPIFSFSCLVFRLSPTAT